tara:strand:- start:100 stop:360 length:261 start_codon:yes stop_codon:yes gene_type:complete
LVFFFVRFDVVYEVSVEEKQQLLFSNAKTTTLLFDDENGNENAQSACLFKEGTNAKFEIKIDFCDESGVFFFFFPRGRGRLFRRCR